MVGVRLGRRPSTPRAPSMSSAPSQYGKRRLCHRSAPWAPVAHAYHLGYCRVSVADGTRGLAPQTQATLLRHVNYDYYNNSVRYCAQQDRGCQGAAGSNTGLAASLYYSSAAQFRWGRRRGPRSDRSDPSDRDHTSASATCRGLVPPRSNT